MFLLYALIRNHSARNFLLAAASLVFYAFGEPVAVLIMLLSIGLNYLFGLGASGALQGELLGSRTANVVPGREGWLFFAGEADDYLGVSALSEAQLRSAAVTLSLLQERTEAGGGRFSFAAAPNKASVYGEYLPARYRQADQSNLTRLQALLPEYGVNYKDLRGLLLEAKDRGVYHRRDSHWNYRGALLGANAILDSLGRPHDDRAGAPEQVERTWRGDLEKLLLPAGNGTDDQIVYEVDHAAFRFTFPPGVEDHQAQLESFMSDREERDMSFGVENTELGDGSRLFMARDSFGRALLPWMIDSYETSFFRRTDAPDLHDLAPGTDVVFEIVEQNLGRLIAKAPFVYAPQRADRDPAALPVGGTLTAALEDSGSVHLYGAFPAGTELGSGRVYLRLEQDGRTLCLEAFPIRERALLGEDAAATGATAAAESGFSAYLDPALALSGTWQLTVLTDAAAWPCNPVELPPAG